MSGFRVHGTNSPNSPIQSRNSPKRIGKPFCLKTGRQTVKVGSPQVLRVPPKSRNRHVRSIENSKLYLGVNVSANDCLFLCGPAMSWWLFHCVTLPSPGDSWERLQLTLLTSSSRTNGYGKWMNEWMHPIFLILQSYPNLIHYSYYKIIVQVTTVLHSTCIILFMHFLLLEDFPAGKPKGRVRPWPAHHRATHKANIYNLCHEKQILTKLK